jgi:hypothetical protein
MEESAPFETVTKLEAAERQLRVAIRMFFERKDMIAVHNLAADAEDVLRALAEARGIKGLYEHADELIRPEYRKEFVDALRSPQNFFKHAHNKDPDEKLEFHYELTKFNLFDAAFLCSTLTGRFPPEILVFHAWFMAKYPKLYIANDPMKMNFLVESLKIFDLDDFQFLVDVIDHANRYGMPTAVNKKST